jgi:hypothetical protein
MGKQIRFRELDRRLLDAFLIDLQTHFRYNNFWKLYERFYENK